MNLFLKYLFLFFIGSTVGWVIELIFRRIVHKKWINPGFLMGPYLPIYGFGLCALTLIYTICTHYNWLINIILMGLSMTLLELIGGLSFLKNGVKLWDYTNQPLNYKGIICPTFSLIWTLIAALYYFFLASPTAKLINWFANNLSFSFILGIFFGIIIIDYIHSTQMFVKMKKFAHDNNIIIKYEELKLKIKELKERHKEKNSFLNIFGSSKSLQAYLDEYKKIKTKSLLFTKIITRKKEKNDK